MSLRIRRGTEAQRSGITFDMGEIVWTTDGQQLWVGDGLTQGGSPVVGPSVIGYGLSYDSVTRRIEVAGLSADDITNGVNNKFFATELAQDAAASLFVTGDHSNISFVYDDELGKINATVTLDGIGLTDIVADTTPQLGGDLDLNSNDITGIGDINITGNITSTTVTGEVFYGNVDTGDAIFNQTSITTENGVFNIGTTASPLFLNLNLDSNLQLQQIVDAENPAGYITSNISRGSLLSRQALQAGDELGGFLIRGYTNATTSAIAGIISFFVADDAVINGGAYIKSLVAISASTDTTQAEEDAFLLDSAGVATSNAFVANKYMQLPVYGDDGARSAAIPTPATGMVVFMTSGTAPTVTNKPVIFNGTAWEAF